MNLFHLPPRDNLQGKEADATLRAQAIPVRWSGKFRLRTELDGREMRNLTAPSFTLLLARGSLFGTTVSTCNEGVQLIARTSHATVTSLHTAGCSIVEQTGRGEIA